MIIALIFYRKPIKSHSIVMVWHQITRVIDSLLSNAKSRARNNHTSQSWQCIRIFCVVKVRRNVPNLEFVLSHVRFDLLFKADKIDMKLFTHIRSYRINGTPMSIISWSSILTHYGLHICRVYSAVGLFSCQSSTIHPRCQPHRFWLCSPSVIVGRR